MTRFTTRVELHDEKSDDYPKLHTQMENRGFKRTVKVGDTTYKMPDASYVYDGDLTREQVYDKARDAVTAVGRKGGVVVTESAGIFLGGLYVAK